MRLQLAVKVPLKIAEDPAPVNLAEFKIGYASAVDRPLPTVVGYVSSHLVDKEIAVDPALLVPSGWDLAPARHSALRAFRQQLSFP